jgi:hypothetical protein
MTKRDFSKDYSTDAYGQLSVEQITAETIAEIMNTIPELVNIPMKRRKTISEQLIMYFLGFYEQGIERGQNGK